MWVSWYATVMRHEAFAAKVTEIAPIALRYGASEYRVQRSLDDRYKITQMTWMEDKTDWYGYWDGPEMIEFRRRNSGHYQIPVIYGWCEEIASGGLGPEVETAAAPEPEPQPEPTAAA